MCNTCPNCGYDLEQLDYIKLGSLELFNGHLVHWKGKAIRFSVCQRLIIKTLVQAKGAVVTKCALCEAIGYDGNYPDGLLSVHICKIRKKFRLVDKDFVAIRTTHGCKSQGGVFWQEELSFINPAKQMGRPMGRPVRSITRTLAAAERRRIVGKLCQ